GVLYCRCRACRRRLLSPLPCPPGQTRRAGRGFWISRDQGQIRRFKMKQITHALCAAAVAFAAAGAADAATLDTVKQRGVLNCGANGQLPGFGFPDSQGNWTGLDVDFCRAIAAAVFNDATKVKFVLTTTANRFSLLQTGDVDVLARNTTWTLS